MMFSSAAPYAALIELVTVTPSPALDEHGSTPVASQLTHFAPDVGWVASSPRSGELSVPTHSPLTARLAARIVTRVARGIPIETVAHQLDLGISTLWAWQTEARNTNTPPREITKRLLGGITHARAHWEWHHLRELDKIALDPSERSSDRVKAITWSLERRPQTRERYGLKVELQHSGAVDHRLTQLEQQQTPEVLDQASPAMRALLEPDV